MSNRNSSAGTAADSSTQPIVNSSADIEASPMLSVGLIVSIFTAAGYEFKEQYPKGRLLFYHNEAETNVQFWNDEENDLTKVMDFICQRAYDLGFSWGKVTVQSEIKKSLGLS